MAFHEERFPVDISYGSQGGPIRKTNIVQLDSGYEHRNTNWQHSKRRYNVNYGIKTYNQIHTVIEFWEARMGPLYGFRYKDWADFKSCAPTLSITNTDQTIATGDGTTTVFQLIKTYTSGDQTYTLSLIHI